MEIIKLDDLNFIKTKSKNRNLLSYIITNKLKKIEINLENIYIPFGIENFNDRSIVNIEINPKIDNYHYNIFAHINAFEKSIGDLHNSKNIGFGLKCDISNKGYYPNIRESKSGYIMRSYINTDAKIHGMINNVNTQLSVQNIKQTISNVKLELGILWINDNNFGILWHLKEIEIIKLT